MLSNTRLHQDRDRSRDEDLPPDYVDRRPGDPAPFADDSDVLAELDRIEAENTPETTLDMGFVPNPLEEKEEREPGTVDQCPRAVRRLIADGPGTIAVWLPCDSRTCGHCKPSIDERDVARISHSLGPSGLIYHAQIPRAHWDRIRKRAQRQGAVTVKMASATDAELIEVLSSCPITAEARPVSMATVVYLVEHRPSWALGRAQTSGPGLVSVNEWEERTTGTKAEVTALDMHHSITVDDVELAAEVLKIPTSREGPYQLRLAAPWTDPRMVALRVWVQDPDGSLEWNRMLWEAETAQGVRLAEEPPLEAYAEAAA